MPHTTQPQTKAPDAAGEGLTATEREQISRRARALWQEEGFPQGRDRELWAQAELQVLKGRTAVRDNR
ncbi:DUF2934 domain-containing protein [Xanthobacter oligotrophicus]|uniref:DUF2934 domain-containing protein n=1 Tax=Xanthobacter oligotrophicus TaxID=2607286 RepID=UPI001E5A536A|nr:DUF2934 domain-containing protein [Xanthobacter oligotrophicus]MCG5237428.1 DUF2934 domain-containing protein [Xanthobacter oligotrophicus]